MDRKILKYYLWFTGVCSALHFLLLNAVMNFGLNIERFAAKMDVQCLDATELWRQPGYNECLNPQISTVLGPAGELSATMLAWLWGGLLVLGVLQGIVMFLTAITDNDPDNTSDTAA